MRRTLKLLAPSSKPLHYLHRRPRRHVITAYAGAAFRRWKAKCTNVLMCR
jgi:hypothetical protein